MINAKPQSYIRRNMNGPGGPGYVHFGLQPNGTHRRVQQTCCKFSEAQKVEFRPRWCPYAPAEGLKP